MIHATYPALDEAPESFDSIGVNIPAYPLAVYVYHRFTLVSLLSAVKGIITQMGLDSSREEA